MQTILILLVCLLPAVTAAAAEDSTVTDTNAVFFEGVDYSYVLAPPGDFQSLIKESMREGYSAAFVPDGQVIDTADVIIGVNFFRLTEDAPDRFLSQLMSEDTAAIRAYFGEGLKIYSIDSMVSATGLKVGGFFFNDPSRFIANVMLAYFDGGSEIITFELIIDEDFPRFRAEELFVETIERFRPLRKGTLGVSD